MQQFLLKRAAVVALLASVAAGSVLIPTAGATRGPRATPTTCATGDTSGSCFLQTSSATVAFNACPQKSVCNATVIQKGKDANHPYGVSIVLPPISGSVPAKLLTPKAGAFAIVLPAATQPKSIQPGFNVSVAEEPTGVFTLQVADKQGHRVTVWSPPLRLVPPAGYLFLQQMNRAGWVRIDPQRVQSPGLYRWTK